MNRVFVLRVMHWVFVTYLALATIATITRLIFVYPAWALLNFWTLFTTFVLLAYNQWRCVLTDLETKWKGITHERLFFPEIVEKVFSIKVPRKIGFGILISCYAVNILAYLLVA